MSVLYPCVSTHVPPGVCVCVCLRRYLEPSIHIAHVLLIKPQLRDDTQLRLDCAKMLWAIADDHNSLLHRTPCNLGWPVDELAGVELSRT